MNNYNYFSNLNENNSIVTPYNVHLFGNNSDIKPSQNDQEQIIKNINYLNDKINNTTFSEVFQTWYDAVSGHSRTKSSNEISKVNDGRMDWDYVSYGYSIRSEDLGNRNYGATGYYFFTKYLMKLGFDLDYIDKPVRMLLRFGGGAYQTIADLRINIKEKTIYLRPDVKRNWYGEEIKDVSSIEAGMDFAKFLIIKENLKEVGVDLDLEKFGYKSVPDYHLVNQEKKDKEIEKLRKEIEELSKILHNLRNNNEKQLP